MDADHSAFPEGPESSAVDEPSSDGLSRRDFARLVIVGTAAAAALPATLADSLPAAAQSIPHEVPLTPAAKAEVKLKTEMVLGQYGSRLSAAQKAEVAHLIVQTQSQLERLRAYKLENGDAPATVFEPYRRERR